MQVVERQQLLLVEVDLVEHLVRFEGVARAGDDELLRRLDLLVAEDVAAQMQPHLAQWPIDSTGHLILSSRQYGDRSRQNSSSSVCSVMAPTRSNRIGGRPLRFTGRCMLSARSDAYHTERYEQKIPP
jgi:hypothetical protein